MRDWDAPDSLRVAIFGTTFLEWPSMKTREQRLKRETTFFSESRQLLRKLQVGISRFSTLSPKRHGLEATVLARSSLETPRELKYSSLGKRVFWGSVARTCGNDLTTFEIWV
jgi:hypothetical protein